MVAALYMILQIKYLASHTENSHIPNNSYKLTSTYVHYTQTRTYIYQTYIRTAQTESINFLNRFPIHFLNILSNTISPN